MCKKKPIKQLPFSAGEYTYMAKGYYESGLYENALECLENAYVLFARDPKIYRGTEEERICAVTYAFIIGKIGEKKEWEKAYRKAEKLCLRAGDYDRYADCLIERGTAFDERSKEGKALKLRKKAIKILKEKTGTKKLLAKAYFFQGTTYYKLKQLDRAENVYLQALDYDSQEKILFALGCVKVSQTDYRKALDYLLGASIMREEQYRDMPFSPQLGEIFALIGDVYSLMKLPVKAVKFYVRALYVYEGMDRVSKTPEYKETLKKLYVTYDALGEKDRAESFRQRWEKA